MRISDVQAASNPEPAATANAALSGAAVSRITDDRMSSIGVTKQAKGLAELAGATRSVQLAQATLPADQQAPAAPDPTTQDLRFENVPTRPDLSGPTSNARTPTPGATYLEGVTPQQLQEALEFQDGYARWQWATGQGVVGPVGNERKGIYAAYNDPADPNFEKYQQFGYHHDMQAADAQLQQRWFSYDVTLATSALRGMDVLQATGDVDRALAAARREWRSSGFDVRTRY